jgi:hypothetical protein
VTYCDATEDIGTKCCPFVSVLIHQLTGPFRIAAPALHDLDKASLVGIAPDIDGDVIAIAEGDFAIEELGGLRPPLVLLGTIAVAAGIFLGFEADDRDGRPSSVTPWCCQASQLRLVKGLAPTA